MEIDIITKQDLEQFKNDLIAEFKEILKTDPHRYPQWIRSADVRKILRISERTLQNMRDQGHIPYSRISGMIFYSLPEIQQLLEENKFGL